MTGLRSECQPHSHRDTEHSPCASLDYHGGQQQVARARARARRGVGVGGRRKGERTGARSGPSEEKQAGEGVFGRFAAAVLLLCCAALRGTEGGKRERG